MKMTEVNFWKSLINIGLTRILVLKVLSRGPNYGYGILKELGSITSGCCTPTFGTIYPILKELTAGPGNPWSIPIAAFVGVPMYIRAETVIPISAALVGKGMGVGTVLALIIGGAGASIPELIILGSMFKKKLVVAFALNVFLVAVVAGYLVDLLVY